MAIITTFVARLKKNTHRASWAVGLVAIIFLIGFGAIALINQHFGLEEKPAQLGVTFSKSYAESLGLDWRGVYIGILDDLKVRRLRIPVYWNDIERTADNFTFENIDWQIDQADSRDAKIILAIGRKLPRWPECHTPEWAKRLSEPQQQARILSMLKTVVMRYSGQQSVVMWQIENEPLFDFGQCPPSDRAFLQKEIALVKSLDTRPVMITESGELSTWVSAASIADVLGISTYRVVWQKYVGYIFWPITPRYYFERAKAVSLLVDRIIISELQAEPWVTTGIGTTTLDAQRALMTPKQLRDNVLFARRIGFGEIYLWGAEWWYLLKTKGYPEMWDTAKGIF